MVTPNLLEAEALTGMDGATRRALAERLVELGARAALVTGGHGDPPVDHLFDGTRHVEIPVERVDVPATHGAGCTHSATLAAELAKGATLEDGVFIGSDTQLVAPVRVGTGAYVAAGTTVTEDVPPGALAITRPPQRNVEGYVERKKRERAGA